MKSIATFDIGTTAVKAVLVSTSGEALYSASMDIPTIYSGSRREQDPHVWWDAFCSLSRQIISAFSPEDIIGIVMSGQMQDVIPVDEACEPVRSAILYSDGRGIIQAQNLIEKLSPSYLQHTTGNVCDGSLSIPKIMWLKENEPEVFNKTACFLISSKDYINAKLTGCFSGDHTACSTAGAMSTEQRAWNSDILKAAGISVELLPQLFLSHEEIGAVTSHAASECGFAAGTPVFCGVGDAGATTLASGTILPGQVNINLGTSGWVATVSEKALLQEGVFNLCGMADRTVINVVPFLNAGNVHHWISSVFSSDGVNPDYENTTRLLDSSEPGAHGVTALPYLVGERFPILDSCSKGAFIGITPTTTPSDMARAMLEGVGYSIRQGIEQLCTPIKSVSVIGGGARVHTWCQILADILNTPITVFSESSTLSARAIASAALIGLGMEKDYTDFVSKLSSETTIFDPHPENVQLYRSLYEKYITLYPILKQWYDS